MKLTKDEVIQVLEAIADPYLPGSVARHLTECSFPSLLSRKLGVTLQWNYPMAGLRDELGKRIGEALSVLDARADVEVRIGQRIVSSRPDGSEPVAGVRNVIAVASGKGGVGKSTVAVNLALALAAEGAAVGILDADIYGPSQGNMLGVPEGTRPGIYDQSLLEPVVARGLQTMSMSYIASERTPMVWRGPMASGALQQLISQTRWQDLDYLVVDMPPGTGDIQLTLSQQVALCGAVIVTTPQDIALLDARKGIEMFQKVNVPVLGIVENMSMHVCSACGHREAIFGEGGGNRIAAEYGTSLLAGLPLRRDVREMLDRGEPPVLADPSGEFALLFRDMARRVGAAIVTAAAGQTQLSMEDD